LEEAQQKKYIRGDNNSAQKKKKDNKNGEKERTRDKKWAGKRREI